jgi:flagellar biosynthesis protein FlhA
MATVASAAPRPLTPRKGGVASLARFADVYLAFGVIGIIVVLVIPIPTRLLDLLLCCQLALSLSVLLGTLYANEPLEFSGFPSLLLFVTLFRVSLNVASSRLILLQADAGQVIASFGDFVVGGNYVVGMTIFLILLVIQFVVITKGAGRVAEVAARFTLDAMPGKQMSIDADLNAGLIDEQQARERRLKIEREASFFGAMDGASKFVRGDAIAALLITAINLLGGLAIGVLQRGENVSDAMKIYALLTVGDGLVSQIPALLVSTASGVIVTRGASEASLGEDLGRQLLLRPRAVAICASILFLFGLVPGLPSTPFMILSIFCFFLAWAVSKGGAESSRTGSPGTPAAAQAGHTPGGRPGDGAAVEQLLKVDALELELGAALIPLAEAGGSGDLLGRIAQIRRRMAAEMGVVMPSIRVRDNLQLAPRQYRVRIRGASAAEGELIPDRLMAINPGNARAGLPGTATRDPAFGLPALWIAAEQRGRAEAFGYTVVDAATVLSTHLHEILRTHSSELLSRQDVQNLVDRVKESDPAVVKDVVPSVIGLPTLHRVLQGLLRERVPVRDLLTILETMGDIAGGKPETVESLVERVRVALAPSFVRALEDPDHKLASIALEPALESRLMQSLVQSNQGPQLVLTPFQVPRLLKAIEAQYSELSKRKRNVTLLCSAPLRPHIHRLIERSLPKLPVLSYLEIPRSTQLEILGQIRTDVLGEESGGLFGAKPKEPGGPGTGSGNR